MVVNGAFALERRSCYLPFVEDDMTLSRRRFLARSAAAAAAAPLVHHLRGSTCDANETAIDFGMGFPHDAIRLNRNENPLGPSEQAIAAALEGVPKSHRYADSILLRSMLAEHHGIDEDWILVGTGSGELLKLAPLVFARNGGNVVSPLETFRTTPSFAEKIGADIRWRKLGPDARYDLDGLMGAVDGDTKIFYLVQPNNPTGTSVTGEELRRIADGLPQGVLFLIDEAYIHFMEQGASGLDLLKEGRKNVLVTRTFSKAYALAGLRIGYGLGHPDIMREIARFGCGPTSTNMAGFGAAVASLADEGHVEKSRTYIQKTRAFYEEAFRRMGLSTIAGAPPFMLIEIGERAGPIRDELAKQKIFVRYGDEWDLPRHIRVSYGLEEENQAFVEALEKII